MSCEVLTGEAEGAATGADHCGGHAALLAPFLGQKLGKNMAGKSLGTLAISHMLPGFS